MKGINKIFKKSCVLMLLLGTISCNSWLDLQPENQQTSDMFWESKEEVLAVLMAAYKQMRECQDNFIQWGELRGDGIDLGSKASNDEQKIKTLDIITSNGVCKWEKMYKVIGRANAVLKYGPLVLERDPTFSEEVFNSYAAEAIFLRSLCYFYLVRTFECVPLVLEPYVDDSQEYAVGVSEESVVLQKITDDLNAYLSKCKPGYEETSIKWQNKGRATQWAYHALLADIELWRGNYDKVLASCQAIYNSQRFEPVTRENWYTLFYPGNSSEGIFELQYEGYNLSQGSKLWEWFYNDGSNSKYILGSKAAGLFENEENTETDLRGAKATYDPDNQTIWKYGGTGLLGVGAKRGDKEKDANWIFYRLTDIRLMEAEAWVMKGGDENFRKAYDIVTEIRNRAGLTVALAVPESEEDALKMVLDERVCEFVGEGKRWFDILRVAKRDNYKYKKYLLDVLLDGIAAKDRPIWNSKLSNVKSYYLPIHEQEIENGKGILVQNPYYVD